MSHMSALIMVGGSNYSEAQLLMIIDSRDRQRHLHKHLIPGEGLARLDVLPAVTASAAQAAQRSREERPSKSRRRPVATDCLVLPALRQWKWGGEHQGGVPVREIYA